MLAKDVAMLGFVTIFVPFKNVFLGFYQPSPMTDVKPIDFFILKS